MEIVTPLYAAAFSLLYVALSVRTLRLRRRFRVAIGPGNDPLLERAVRVHGNFAEYVPLSLLLLLFVDIRMTSELAVHALGLTLLLGRLLHAWGVSRVAEDFRFRVAGMAMTFTVLISAALLVLATYTPLMLSPA
jgi:uncharacterized membrane protein YecN with MAPEG domain